MGFNPFKKARKFVKKLIPKEIRPFIPYIAAAMGPASFATTGIFSNPAITKALLAGGTKFATDDEADLKDIGITAALAAAPDALGQFSKSGEAAKLSMGDKGFFKQQAQLASSKLAGKAADSPYLTMGAQAGIDTGIKQAELNQQAIDDYNASLLSQGMQNKGDRRTAIFNIFKNANYDEDDINIMLDKYGYADGGRAGYRYGTMVKTKAPPSAASDNGIMEVIKVDAETDKDDDKKELSIEEFIEMMKGGDDNDIEDSLDYAQQGLGMLQGNVKPMPMMRFADGGDVEIDFGGIREAVENSPMSNERVVQMYVSDSAGVIPLADGDAVKGKTMDMMAIGAIEPYGKDDFRDPDGYERFIDIFTEFKNRNDQKNKELNSEGMKEGGLMNLGGREMDMRKGGFIPIGKKERADDVPARLSKNEFVMTANAVRAAGGGSVNKGAKRMYNLMNNLEARK